MPSAKRPGRNALYVELSEELDARLRARCEAIGSKIADEVRLAIRRHLDYPPSAVTPPLPTETSKTRRAKS